MARNFGMSIVEEISDERKSFDGVWFYLKAGYIWDNETHIIHEKTMKLCKEQLKNVTRCECEQCKQLLKEATK